VQVLAVTAPAPERAARSRRDGEVPQIPEARTNGLESRTPAMRQERSTDSEASAHILTHRVRDLSLADQGFQELGQREGGMETQSTLR